MSVLHIMETRKFVPSAVNHCYQKSIHGEVLFYNVCDYLSCFTLFCTAARRHQVQVLSLVIMPDHLHHCTIAQEQEELSAFVQDYTSHLAWQNNELCHHKGSIFLRPFGSAPKLGDKSARTALIYLGNNGPERKLSAKAVEYRWSFLAYFRNPSPFSEPLRMAIASKGMRRAVALIKSRVRKNLPLRYQTLKWMMGKLNDPEKRQLTDFIIRQYNVVDYDEAISYFGSYEDMLEAMRLTKGSEHEIREEFVGWDDRVYGQMSKLLQKEKGLADVHEMLAWPEDKRRELIPLLRNRTHATDRQVRKYLRLVDDA